MDERAMTDLSMLPLSAILAVCFAGGFALGYVYFRALRETADLIVAGRRPLVGLALTLGRLALLCAGFYLAVLAGGAALLAALAGVLGAKALMLRQPRKADR
jgi:F1F0 ATPase subunit 2